MTHTDDLFELHEAELRDLLERSMMGAPVPRQIGPQSLRHGRRLRTRRRVGVAAGAIAASLAAALIVPAALGGGSATVVDPAGGPSSSASADTAPTPDPAERPDGWWDMPAVDMVSTVEAILPDGVSVTSPGPLTTDEGVPATGYVVPRLDTSAGPGRLIVMLSPAPEPSGPIEGPGITEIGADTADIDCDVELSGETICTQIRDEQQMIIGRRLTHRTSDTVTNEVALRRDGGTVYAAAANTLDTTWRASSPISAELPPLTIEQLEDLVRNDTWVMPAT